MRRRGSWLHDLRGWAVAVAEAGRRRRLIGPCALAPMSARPRGGRRGPSGPGRRDAGGPYHRGMNYELFMGEALAEAPRGARAGERPGRRRRRPRRGDGRPRPRPVRVLGDPTAHAVLVALRGAARRLGTDRLAGSDHLLHGGALRDVRRGAPAVRRRRARLRAAGRRARRGRVRPPAGGERRIRAAAAGRAAASGRTRRRSCSSPPVADRDPPRPVPRPRARQRPPPRHPPGAALPTARLTASPAPARCSRRPVPPRLPPPLLSSRAERCPSG